MPGSPLRVAVLASGRGSNFQALQDACSTGYASAEITCLLTNKADAPVAARAKASGVEVVAVRHRGRSPEEVDEIVLKAFAKRGIRAAFNAGYMRIRGPAYSKAVDGRAFNIHPSLLPAFPGAHPIQDAWDWGVKVSGVTTHFATEDLDMGPIIEQRIVEIRPDDTIESFEERIHLTEYAMYPKVLKLYAEGLLRLDGRKVVVDRDVDDPPWAGSLPPGLASGSSEASPSK